MIGEIFFIGAPEGREQLKFYLAMGRKFLFSDSFYLRWTCCFSLGKFPWKVVKKQLLSFLLCSRDLLELGTL